jgi:hypothetical protein
MMTGAKPMKSQRRTNRNPLQSKPAKAGAGGMKAKGSAMRERPGKAGKASKKRGGL